MARPSPRTLARILPASVFLVLGVLPAASQTAPPAQPSPARDAAARDREALRQYGLAQNALRAGRLEEALGHAGAAADLAPARPEALLLAGRLEYALGNFEDAVSAWEAALRRVEALPLAARGRYETGKTWFNIGEAWERAEEPGKALAAFENARESLPPAGGEIARTLVRIAGIHRRLGELGPAQAAAAAAVEADPGQVEAHALLAPILLGTGDAAGARREFETVLSATPEDPDALLGLASALEALGEAGEAAAARRRGEALRSERVVREETRRRAGSLRQEGLAHAAKGEYPEARPKLEEAVRVSGGDPGILTDLGVLYREMGMTRLAVSTFREALSKREDLAAAHAALGAIEAEAGRPFRALDHLARAVDLDPDDPLTRYNLAGVYVQIGRPDDAIAHYTEAAVLRPGAPEIEKALAALFRAVGDPRRAAMAEGRWNALTGGGTPPAEEPEEEEDPASSPQEPPADGR